MRTTTSATKAATRPPGPDLVRVVGMTATVGAPDRARVSDGDPADGISIGPVAGGDGGGAAVGGAPLDAMSSALTCRAPTPPGAAAAAPVASARGRASGRDGAHGRRAGDGTASRRSRRPGFPSRALGWGAVTRCRRLDGRWRLDDRRRRRDCRLELGDGRVDRQPGRSGDCPRGGVGGDDRQDPVPFERLAGEQPEVDPRGGEARSGRQDQRDLRLGRVPDPGGGARDLVVDVEVEDRSAIVRPSSPGGRAGGRRRAGPRSTGARSPGRQARAA